MTEDLKTDAPTPSNDEHISWAEPPDPSDARRSRLLCFLQREAWPMVPADEMGRRMSPAEVETLLGYGPDGI